MKKNIAHFAKASLVALVAAGVIQGEIGQTYTETAEAAAQMQTKPVPEMVVARSEVVTLESIFNGKPARELIKGIAETIAARSEQEERDRDLSKNVKAEEALVRGNIGIYSAQRGRVAGA